MCALRNNKVDEVGKALMKCLTMQVHLQKKVYKYLTYESGRLMLENSNIQFTRAILIQNFVFYNSFLIKTKSLYNVINNH